MVRRRGVSERPHVPQHQGHRRLVRIEPGRLPIEDGLPRVPEAMSRSPVGRVLERTQGEGSRQRARGSPSRGKKSACLASGRLRGAARTGTLPEFWTPGLSLILGMSTADQILEFHLGCRSLVKMSQPSTPRWDSTRSPDRLGLDRTGWRSRFLIRPSESPGKVKSTRSRDKGSRGRTCLRRSRSGPPPAWPGSRCLSRLPRQCPTHLCQGQSEDVGEILVVVAAFGLLPQDSVLIPPTEGAPKRTSGSMTTGDSRLASGRQLTAVSCSHVTRSSFLLRLTYQPASAHERSLVSQRVGHSQALALFGLWLSPFA
jgi:hypothetical protein